MITDNDEIHDLAVTALGSMLQQFGPDHRFPPDAIWQQVPENDQIQSTKKPHQPKRLVKEGYLRDTGAKTRAQSGPRAGSTTNLYEFGPVLVPAHATAAPTSAVLVTAPAGTAPAAGAVSPSEALKAIQEAMEAEGYLISVAELANFFLAMTVSPLVILPGAEARRIRSDSEHHHLNFGNNVGFSDIAIKTNSGSARLRLEVFSHKADYRTDYVAMRDEVSAMLRNLAMAANAKTFGLAAPAKDHYPTLVEWFALLQGHFNEFMHLTNGIAKNPHSGLVRKSVSVDTERARRVSRQTISRALRRQNSGAAIPSLGVALPRKIHESVSSPTFDTPENRYFKALIKATYQNIRALSSVDESGDEDADRYSEKKFFDSIRPTLKGMERQLESVLRSPFLGQVAEATLARPKSMVFHKHPLYSRFDKLCRLLNGGLSFAGNIVPIGVK
jgi:hypothetical protein